MIITLPIREAQPLQRMPAGVHPRLKQAIRDTGRTKRARVKVVEELHLHREEGNQIVGTLCTNKLADCIEEDTK